MDNPRSPRGGPRRPRLSRSLGRVKRIFLSSFKRYGWKFGAVIFLYYLIRDTVLYIIIPYLIAMRFFTG